MSRKSQYLAGAALVTAMVFGSAASASEHVNQRPEEPAVPAVQDVIVVTGFRVTTNVSIEEHVSPEQAPVLGPDAAGLVARLPGAALVNRVRAFNPWPVAWVDFDGQPLRIWDAEEVPDTGEPEPGRIVTVSDDGLTVACGDGAVLLSRVQLPGKRPMTVAEVRRGHPELFQPGATLE